jgi:hypothetical protein
LHNTKFLKIRYSEFEDDELTVVTNEEDYKHVFKVAVDVSFANKKKIKSAEDYTFKLFEKLIS